MVSTSARFIFLFLDGVGLGQADVHNPLACPETTPFLSHLLGGALLKGLRVNQAGLLFQPIDPILGVPGLPQSATGQTALFTGQNAPAFLGRHLSAFANGSLRQLIEESGLFKQVLGLGGSVTHANLYSPAYFEAIAQRRRRYSVGTLVTLTAGVPFRMGRSDRDIGISWDITGDYVNQRGGEVPSRTPELAGQILAQLGREHHLTLFECYLPDYAGHEQNKLQAIHVMQVIDAFIASVVAHLSPEVTLVVSSDHGNIEDLSTKQHTRNPVPLLAIGPHATAFREVEAIAGITPQIVALFNLSSTSIGKTSPQPLSGEERDLKA